MNECNFVVLEVVQHQKLNNSEARIQAFDPRRGSGNGKVSEE
jgi:hypothetical protein